jgi:hypothetical protein
VHVRKVHPLLCCALRQRGRGLARQPFGIAHMARFAGRCDEKEKFSVVGHAANIKKN